MKKNWQQAWNDHPPLVHLFTVSGEYDELVISDKLGTKVFKIIKLQDGRKSFACWRHHAVPTEVMRTDILLTYIRVLYIGCRASESAPFQFSLSKEERKWIHLSSFIGKLKTVQVLQKIRFVFQEKL